MRNDRGQSRMVWIGLMFLGAFWMKLTEGKEKRDPEEKPGKSGTNCAYTLSWRANPESFRLFTPTSGVPDQQSDLPFHEKEIHQGLF